MDLKLRFILLTTMTVAAILVAGTAWAHPGAPHIHEGPMMMQDHNAHSPFHQHSQHVQTKNEEQSLHCILNGHSPDEPCPHKKTRKTDSRDSVRISTECGGHAGPVTASIVKTQTTYFAVTSTPEETVCLEQELFPAIHPLLSRSHSEIAPPPKRALLSY